jgi:hypothetical protein
MLTWSGCFSSRAKSRHLTDGDAKLGLSLVDLVCRRASLDGILVGGHGNAERL